MIGILPFLVQWLALSQLGNRNQRTAYPQFSSPPKSHWTLLSEFQQLPEDEIESFLPQICNILIERDVNDEYGVYDHFERILIEKCSGCLTFGIRVCGLLKAASQGPSEGIFKHVLSINPTAVAREERLRRLQEHCEAATSHGNNLPYRISQLRSSYYRDCQFLTETLARLGNELKSYPVPQRNQHLRTALSQVNAMLHNKMLTRGTTLEAPSDALYNPDPNSSNFGGLSPQMVAQACPDAASYSLHLPLLHCREKAMRLLQFVESECEVLPSKERCPYVLVAELLEQPFTCKSEELYTQGHEVGVTIEDVIQGRMIYPGVNRGGGGGRQTQSQEEYLLPQGFCDRELLMNRQAPVQGADSQWSGSRSSSGASRESDYTSILETNSDGNDYIFPSSPNQHASSDSSNNNNNNNNNVQAFARDSFMSDNSAAASSTYGHTTWEQRQLQQQQQQQQQPRFDHYGNPSSFRPENVDLFARVDVAATPVMDLGAAVAADYLDKLAQHVHTAGSGSHAAATSAAAFQLSSAAAAAKYHPSTNNRGGYDETKLVGGDKLVGGGAYTTDTEDMLNIAPSTSSPASSTGSTQAAAAQKGFSDFFRGGHTAPSSSPPPALPIPYTPDEWESVGGSSGGGSGNRGSPSRPHPPPSSYGSWQSYTATAAATPSSAAATSGGGGSYYPPNTAPNPSSYPEYPSSSNPYAGPGPAGSGGSGVSGSGLPGAAASSGPYGYGGVGGGGGRGEYNPHGGFPTPPTGPYGGPHEQYQQPIYPIDQYSQYGGQQQQPQQGGGGHYDLQGYHQQGGGGGYPPVPQQYSGGSGGGGVGGQQSEFQQFNSQLMRKTFVKGKTWEEKRDLVQRMSAFGHLPGWTLKSFIVKSGDDLRKEQLAMQIIDFCQHVFKTEDLDIFLRPYQIISTGQQSGLVEFLEGARSVDRIKKSSPDVPTLKEFFEFNYGATYSVVHARAVHNFVKSLVGYSLVTYLLQVKDRHNANILVDTDGHVIHIDFGFILGDSPGFNINFENAPFKLTREYLEVLGGLDSAAFKQFEDLFVRGFFALQKHVDGLCAITQLFYGEKRKTASDSIRSRLMFARTQADVLTLIRESLDNWRTKQYDWYQQRANNILM